MKRNVSVLMGGVSAEREVSLRSGTAVLTALHSNEMGANEINAIGFDVTDDLSALIHHLTSTKPDIVFNALHGQFGEDGVIQGILNYLGIKYTHSGVLASSAAMNKVFARDLFASNGLTVAMGKTFDKKQGKSRVQPLPYPYVVKPINEGSSVGVYIVKNESESAILTKWPFKNDTVLIEEFIAGRELTVAVMGERALGVLEITSEQGFYDYNAKYSVGGSKHIMPAPIPPQYYDLACQMALKAHQVLGCRGVSRADFRFDDTHPNHAPRLVILEVNTQPGMTATSLVPEMAAYQGLSFTQLVHWMIEAAACDP